MSQMLDQNAGDRDGDTVRSAVWGNRDAFETLLRRRHAALRRFAYRMVGDDADDALQEAYVAAYRGIGQFQPETEASFSNWLYRLVYTASIDVLRRRKRAAARVRALMERPQPAAWTELTSQQADLIDALTDLEPDLRAAVLLVDAHGVGYRETAGILGISEGTLASRLHRARGRVRAALEGEG